MEINIHAGHNPDGKTGCGACGLIKESTEARIIKDLVIKYLKADGHTVYDCTVDNAKNASDCLVKIVAKCNAHKVDKDVSIHFNSGVNDPKGNGVTSGTETLIYSSSSKMLDEAKAIAKNLSKIGFRYRGVKVRNDLYYLKKVTNSCVLVEVCFVSDKDDVDLYLKNKDKVARAIAEGIVGREIKANVTTTTNSISSSTTTKPTTNTSTSSSSTSKVTANMKTYQKWLNTNFKTNLVVDGKWGVNTKKASVKAWQTTMNTLYKTNLKVNGVFDNACLSVASKGLVKNGSKNNLVRILQGVLNAYGFVCTVDGNFGSGTKSCVVSFQKAKRLTPDGMVGKQSWNSLLK